MYIRQLVLAEGAADRSWIKNIDSDHAIVSLGPVTQGHWVTYDALIGEVNIMKV